MKGKRIIISVSNDLLTDQRVHRTADSLAMAGAIVLVLGRNLKKKGEPEQGKYRLKRFRFLFSKGALFYAGLNLRLCLYLIFSKVDLIVSNDLDTLPGSFLASSIRSKPLVYDSHEFFTEVPELIGRERVRNIWERIERIILPRLDYTSTVSESIAGAYYKKYGVRMEVIRNLPLKEVRESKRPDLLVRGPMHMIIYQGALNIGRGLETMILAMKYLDSFQFQIFGEGDISEDLKELVRDNDLGDRVEFRGRVPFRELRAYTRQASLGISLEEDRGLNYRYALPNKLFDYIQAKVPVLVSGLPEMRKIVEDYNIGQVVKEKEPEKLAGQVKHMMNADSLREEWKKNLKIAASELCWENEEGKLLDLYNRALSG